MTRQEAIARIKRHKVVHKLYEPRAAYISEALDMAIEALQQEPKRGKWEYREIANSSILGYWCNQCHIGTSKAYEFCPHCGARMESEG